jgi:glycosyltransferase involved in cell wall biosynthesis
MNDPAAPAALAVGIVIPAYNEAATIGRVVAAAGAHGRVFVADDGSRDDTGALAAGAGAVVVRLPGNSGYDGAINAAFAAAADAGCEVVVTMDADGQHDPALIPLMASRIAAGAEVVCGTRPSCARFAERVLAGYARARWGLRDPLCGMKAYRVAVYRELGCFDDRRSIGTQLLFFAARRGCRIEQVPVPIAPRHDAPRFGRVWSANLRILKVLLRDLLRGSGRRAG